MASKRLEERRLGYAEYLAQLDKQTCPSNSGDYNVAHKWLTLPTQPVNQCSPGFMTKNVKDLQTFLSKGFTDTFRHIHGDARLYLVGTT